jgi:hypothetical protein
MSITDLLVRLAREVFWGDRPPFGRLRFYVLVIIPLLLPLVELEWVLLRLIYPLPSLAAFQHYFFGSYSPLIHKLLGLYFLGLLSAFAAGVAYIKDIYELDSDRMPAWHLASSFLGLAVPTIRVSNRVQESAGTEMVERIGGPAHLNVASGYAVLTETLVAPANIYGPGSQRFISRRERIHEFVDLREQAGKFPDVTATTRDGIHVIVENIRYNFRLWDIYWDTDPTTQPRTLNPYPFSKDAIHKYVYNRSVAIGDDGLPKPFSWSGMVGGRVAGIVKEYIGEHRLDEVLAAPEHKPEKNPRRIIRNMTSEGKFRDSLRDVGTVLRWWDPGEFKSLEPIEEQFLSNWSVDIRNTIDLNKAYGHAQKDAYEELGRAESEAELLMTIIHSLDGIKFTRDKPQTLQNLILMRTAQVIHALNTPGSQVPPRESDDKQKPGTAGLER